MSAPALSPKGHLCTFVEPSHCRFGQQAQAAVKANRNLSFASLHIW
jgi:hypothetical protein